MVLRTALVIQLAGYLVSLLGDTANTRVVQSPAG